MDETRPLLLPYGHAHDRPRAARLRPRGRRALPSGIRFAPVWARPVQHAEATGQAAPPAEPPVDGVDVLVQGMDLGFERLDACVEVIHAVTLLWGKDQDRGQ